VVVAVRVQQAILPILLIHLLSHEHCRLIQDLSSHVGRERDRATDAPFIDSELLKLGFEIAESTVYYNQRRTHLGWQGRAATDPSNDRGPL
jgi:hypothetical protein